MLNSRKSDRFVKGMLLSSLITFGALSAAHAAPSAAVAAQPAQASHPEQKGEKNQVPSFLLETTQRSLDLINLLNRMDGPRSQESVQRLVDRLPELKKEAATQKLPGFMVDVLQVNISNLPHTIADGEYYEAVVLTNQIASILGTMISYYEPRIPFILGRMDYLVRDVNIHANFGDFDYALVRVGDLRAEWKTGLTDDLKTHGGTALIKQFEEGIASLEVLVSKKDRPGIVSRTEEMQKTLHSMQDLYRI